MTARILLSLALISAGALVLDVLQRQLALAAFVVALLYGFILLGASWLRPKSVFSDLDALQDRALGELVPAFTHQLNNALNIVVGNAAVLGGTARDVERAGRDT